MKQLRTALFWLHLLCGVVAGLVILVMSGTGVILALKPQIQDWIERDVRYVTPQARRGSARTSCLTRRSERGRTRRRSRSRLLAIRRQPPPSTWAARATCTSIRTPAPFSEPAPPHRAVLPDDDELASVSGCHRRIQGDGRSATGVSNLAFLVLAVTGLYIWWPKQLTLQYLKPIVWFRRTSTGRARDFNWHNTIGFWCLIPIVIMTVSGAVLSYPWASDLVYRATAHRCRPRGGGPRVPRAAAGGDGRPSRPSSIASGLAPSSRCRPGVCCRCGFRIARVVRWRSRSPTVRTGTRSPDRTSR